MKTKKTLEVLGKLAESDNKVFVPMGALDSIGLKNAIFSNQLDNDRKAK